MRFRKKTVLYAAGVLACGNIALQALGFVYRVMLSRFAGAEGLGMYRLANSVYLVLHTGCLSGVTMACSRLSAACEATGEKGKTGAVLRLAFSVFFTLAFASAAGAAAVRRPNCSRHSRQSARGTGVSVHAALPYADRD